jgi:hypothetical protein
VTSSLVLFVLPDWWHWLLAPFSSSCSGFAFPQPHCLTEYPLLVVTLVHTLGGSNWVITQWFCSFGYCVLPLL